MKNIWQLFCSALLGHPEIFKVTVIALDSGYILYLLKATCSKYQIAFKIALVSFVLFLDALGFFFFSFFLFTDDVLASGSLTLMHLLRQWFLAFSMPENHLED